MHRIVKRICFITLSNICCLLIVIGIEFAWVNRSWNGGTKRTAAAATVSTPGVNGLMPLRKSRDVVRTRSCQPLERLQQVALKCKVFSTYQNSPMMWIASRKKWIHRISMSARRPSRTSLELLPLMLISMQISLKRSVLKIKWTGNWRKSASKGCARKARNRMLKQFRAYMGTHPRDLTQIQIPQLDFAWANNWDSYLLVDMTAYFFSRFWFLVSS